MVEASSRVTPPPRNQLLWFSPSGSRNLLPLGSNFAVMALPAPGFGESHCSIAKAKCQGTVCPRRKTKPATAINQRARMVFLRKYCIASTVLDPTTATANILDSGINDVCCGCRGVKHSAGNTVLPQEDHTCTLVDGSCRLCLSSRTHGTLALRLCNGAVAFSKSGSRQRHYCKIRSERKQVPAP